MKELYHLILKKLAALKRFRHSHENRGEINRFRLAQNGNREQGPRSWRIKRFRLQGRNRKVLAGLLALIVLIVVGFWLFKSIWNLRVNSSLTHEQTLSPKQALANPTLQQVNELFKLFPDQNVTIGEIKDVKALSSTNSFFKKARNGDFLLIYPDMTIIYDPATKTVVDIAKVKLLK